MPCIKLNGRKSMLVVTPKIPKDARMFDIQMLKDENVHEHHKARVELSEMFPLFWCRAGCRRCAIIESIQIFDRQRTPAGQAFIVG